MESRIGCGCEVFRFHFPIAARGGSHHWDLADRIERVHAPAPPMRAGAHVLWTTGSTHVRRTASAAVLRSVSAHEVLSKETGRASAVCYLGLQVSAAADQSRVPDLSSLRGSTSTGLPSAALPEACCVLLLLKHPTDLTVRGSDRAMNRFFLSVGNSTS